MKKSLCGILIVLILSSVTESGAQTKKISHKSHSGSRHTFRKALMAALFHLPGDNFGITYNYHEKNIYNFSAYSEIYTAFPSAEVYLDSLIAVNDTSVMLITSTQPVSWGEEPTIHKRRLVYHNPIFTPVKSSHEINELLVKNTSFKIPLSGTKYIGFKPEQPQNYWSWLALGIGLSAVTLVFILFKSMALLSRIKF